MVVTIHGRIDQVAIALEEWAAAFVAPCGVVAGVVRVGKEPALEHSERGSSHIAVEP